MESKRLFVERLTQGWDVRTETVIWMATSSRYTIARIVTRLGDHVVTRSVSVRGGWPMPGTTTWVIRTDSDLGSRINMAMYIKITLRGLTKLQKTGISLNFIQLVGWQQFII